MIALTFLARHWKLITLGLAVAAVLALLAWNARVSSERDALRIEVGSLEQQIATIGRDMSARETAATERVTDTQTITIAEKERTDAITAAPPSATGAASRALGCVRWKRAHPGAAAPAACR